MENASIGALMAEKKKTTNTNLIRQWLRHWPNVLNIVIIVSALTRRGGILTFKAIQRGKFPEHEEPDLFVVCTVRARSTKIF